MHILFVFSSIAMLLLDLTNGCPQGTHSEEYQVLIFGKSITNLKKYPNLGDIKLNTSMCIHMIGLM